MRIGGKPAALGLLSEVKKLLLGDAPLDEGPSVDAWSAMPLEVHHVTAMLGAWRVEEVIETDVIEGCR